jgi:hypothetical protein
MEVATMNNDRPEAESRPQCVSCKAVAPHTTTDHTVISSFGWRLGRRAALGRFVMEWRCPTCFKRFKESQKGHEPVAAVQASKLGRLA